MDDQRTNSTNTEEEKTAGNVQDFDSEAYTHSSRYAHDASAAPHREAGGVEGGEGEQQPLDEYDRALGSEPIVGRDGALADARLPDEYDWDYRPGSHSEWFAQPETEKAFARTFLHAEPNYPALTGIGLAIFGFAAGLFGFIAAALGLVFSATGIWSSRHGAKRAYLGVVGVVVSVIYLAGHIAAAI